MTKLRQAFNFVSYIFALMQNETKDLRIGIVGSGNMATRLTKVFIDNGQKPATILSSSESGRRLSATYSVPRISLPSEASHVDLWLVCLRDDLLTPEFASRFPEDVLLCHTAGSLGLDAFGHRKRNGVFYPLQTLSKEREVDFQNIPLCIEATVDSDLTLLEALANRISDDVRRMNSEQRLTAHLAAVFVSNFVNHFYKIGKELLLEKSLDFDLLKPLILETASKVLEISPEKAQTGPAMRNDSKVMEKHLELLKDNSQLAEIYNIISKSIQNGINGRSEKL
ncbi:MAG: DUF2520 domain-containing protein [Bacteroidales bacterium]|nr:DUF2520 domain-containing protein [Bacteroidales bacterium]